MYERRRPKRHHPRSRLLIQCRIGGARKPNRHHTRSRLLTHQGIIDHIARLIQGDLHLLMTPSKDFMTEVWRQVADDLPRLVELLNTVAKPAMQPRAKREKPGMDSLERPVQRCRHHTKQRRGKLAQGGGAASRRSERPMLRGSATPKGRGALRQNGYGGDWEKVCRDTSANGQALKGGWDENTGVVSGEAVPMRNVGPFGRCCRGSPASSEWEPHPAMLRHWPFLANSGPATDGPHGTL